MRHGRVQGCLRSAVPRLLAAALLAGAVAADVAAGEADGAGSVRFEMTPEIARHIRDGQEAMYDCDFAAADREYEAIVRLHPDHPAGYMYLAANIWWRCMLNPSDKELQTRFLRLAAEGTACGEKRVAADPRDFYARMFLAGIYGNEARFYQTVAHSPLDAGRAGLKGDRYNREALALRPDCADCLIGTGSYFYAPYALPWWLHPLAALAGVRGDKARSLKDLQTAAEKGEFARTEARLTLLGIYFNERWDDRYEAMLLGLIHDYPSNPVLLRWFADFCLRQNRADDGIGFFTELLEGPLAYPRTPSARGYVLLETARLHLAGQAAEAALACLDRGIAAAPVDGVFQARARLLRGCTLDLAGRRAEALREYQAVLALPEVEGTRRRAEKYSRSPYRGE